MKVTGNTTPIEKRPEEVLRGLKSSDASYTTIHTYSYPLLVFFVAHADLRSDQEGNRSQVHWSPR